MRQLIDKKGTLHRALANLTAATGLRASILKPQENGQPQPLLQILVDGQTICFAAEVRTVDRFQTLEDIAKRADPATGKHLTELTINPQAIRETMAMPPYPLVLVAPHITEAVARRCRELRLPFIDEAGNAYLEAPGLFIYVTGQRRPVQTRAMPAFRALTPAGLRIVFALLYHLDMPAAPYRAIARAAGVALGTVGEVLTDLEQRGHLAPEKPGPRRLLAPERLQEEWATHYPIKLRPKLNARRFAAPTPDWWRNQNVRQYQAWWGGEVAADKLTGYLKPARFTLYVEGRPDRLILANRLRPDVDGAIEILEAFWPEGAHRQPDDIAPPLVVYADLIATNDPRNIEAANIIRERYLAQALRAA